MIPKSERDMLVARAMLAGVKFEEYKPSPEENGWSNRAPMWRWKLPNGAWVQYGMYTIVRAAIKALGELGHLSRDDELKYLMLTEVPLDDEHPNTRSGRGKVTELPSEEHGNDDKQIAV